MLRDDAILVILNRVGQRGGGAGGALDTSLQSQAVTEMKFAQEQLERGEKANLPWFLDTVYVNASFKTAIDSHTVAVPTGFLRELEEETVTLYYQDTEGKWQPLDKVDYDEGHHEFANSSAGAPQAYTLIGENYNVWPKADAEYSLKALVSIADAVLSSNIENKWLKYAAQLLIGKTGMVVAELARDAASREYFSSMAARGHDALTRDTVARREMGRMRTAGED